MNDKAKLNFNTRLDLDKPISAEELRLSYPAELDQAETPETVISKMKRATNNVQYLPEMLSLTEAAERTNLSYEYLRLLCQQNKINHLRCGRKYMIDSGSLAEFIRRGGADQ